MFALLVGTAGPVQAQEPQAESPTYTVQEGDTLFGIARRFGTSVRALREWNDLDGSGIQIGQTLRVRPPSPARFTGDDTPAPQESGQEPSSRPPHTTAAAVDSDGDPGGRAADSTSAPGRTTGKSGDTLIDIALRFGTTADTLYAMNDSLRAPLEPGRTVFLPSRFGAPSHTVQPGETLYSIAGSYGVSVRALQTENDLDGATIQPGQQLVIPGRAARGNAEPPAPDTAGAVAVYPNAFSGRLTASGETYDPEAFVGSHPTLPYGSVVLLSHPGARRHSFVRIIDRGPVEDDVVMDVSRAVAARLGLDEKDRTSLQFRIVWVETGR
jgi:LysM repeat protein